MANQKKPPSTKHQYIRRSPDVRTSSGPSGSSLAGLASLNAEASALSNAGWQSLQKQALAQQIGQTHGNEHLQRALAAASAIIQRQQRSFTQARSMADYVALVRAAEQQFAGRTPRQMLAMLRQVYYGKAWSTSSTRQWEDVLPQSPNVGDPRSQLGQGQGSLFAALQASQVVAGTDIGHLLTGLEALLDPQQSIELEVTGPNPVVKMPNTEFATWGGDLGSAAGQMVADAVNKSNVRTPQHYFAQMASGADMEGNIDAYVLNKGTASAGGLRALLGVGAKPGQGTAVSQILQGYYLAPTSALGQAHQNRYELFAQIIGGTVQNKKITNQTALLNPIATRVTEFGYIWILKEVKKKSGTVTATGLWASESQVKALLMPVSKLITQLFFQWLEARL